ncbi:MAG: primosomal protein N' [Thermodesulfovibrionales bacterium]|nr:primosomal protein N' [Thermodesulfovibrionales bacterium]
MFAQVAFPLNLKSLTYRLPEGTSDNLIGRVVKAPLGNKILYGVICYISETPYLNEEVIDTPINTSKIKEIISIHDYCMPLNTLNFLKWLSSYYISSFGLSISTYPLEDILEIIEKFGLPSTGKIATKTSMPLEKKNFSNNINDEVSQLIHSIEKRNYKTFLFHSPSINSQKKLLKELFQRSQSLISGSIVLVPEINEISETYNILKEIAGGRVCCLFSKQSKKKRLETLKGVLWGEHDIVVGTRSALFAPLKEISLIIVLNEQNFSYKAEEGLRYNGKDAAVMRGFLEKSTVLLTSLCPSVESYYNVLRKKYFPLNIPANFKSKKPNIEIIHMGRASQMEISISKKILTSIKKYIQLNEKFLFIINKMGFSLIVCNDCGFLLRCSKCDSPLTFSKRENLLSCNKCGLYRQTPTDCDNCKGANLKTFGVGIERVYQDLTSFFGKDAVYIPKDEKKLPITDLFAQCIVGNLKERKKFSEAFFKAIIFSNIDSYLFDCSFRADERLFQDVTYIKELVKPDGCIYLQTRNANHKILNFLKKYDLLGFYNYELAIRREADLPPFARLILFDIFSKKEIPNIKEKLNLTVNRIKTEETKILGPLELKNSNYKTYLRLLIKSKNLKQLQNLAFSLKEKISTIKGLQLKIDVDPIMF